MPDYMTNLILVFSGLLTGYLLWHRDRRNETLLQQSLKKDNHDLHASLTLAHATHRQLNDRFQRQTSQLNVLQRLCDELNDTSQHASPSSGEGTDKPRSEPLQESGVLKVDDERFDSTADLEQAIAENTALKKRLENQESTIHAITKRNQESLGKKEDEYSERISRLEHRICSQAESIKKTDKHLEDLAVELDVSQKNLVVSESALMESNSRTAKLNKKIENLKATCLRISQYESHMQGVEIENKQLKLANQTLQNEQQDILSAQQELSNEIDNLRRANLQSDEEANNRLTAQKAKELESSETIENLRLKNDQLQQERVELLARLANQQSVAEADSAIISFAKAMEQRKSQSQQYDAEHQGHLVKHAQRGMLFTSPPKKPDNLKFISGVTEILEARLNDCGIYSYKQILNWSEEAVTEFSNQLGIAESLITNTWKQQAEFLAQPKTGKAAA
ncbi:MAG: hypothetical protein GY748_16730 [Planctomycetaceae bacterium]|nr:hypothetical protein [Planctomycetaceae bacterium]